MILVICLDQKNGMTFNRRRQSKDRQLRKKLLELTGGKPLWMNAYSAGQFEEAAENLCVSEDFLHRAGEGEFCFAENADITPWLSRAEALIVYRWDRTYPADVRFSPSDFSEKTAQTEEFEGYSHEIIIQERYQP